MTSTHDIFLITTRESFISDAERAATESGCVRISGHSAYTNGTTPPPIVEALKKGTAVLLDLDSDPIESLKTLQDVRSRNPEARVLVATRDRDVDAMLQFMRAGASDFIPVPLESETLADALGRLMTTATVEHDEVTPAPSGRVLSFVSAKGGCGATTLATNLAVSLAEAGRSTILIDLDMPGGDITAMLRLEPTYTLADVSDNIHRLDMSLLASMTMTHASGVKFLASAGEGSAPRWVDGENLGAIVSFLREHYDDIVLAGGGVGESEMAAINQAHMVHVVTTLDFVSLRRAQGVMTRLRGVCIAEDSLRVVVNRLDRSSELSLADAKQTLEAPVSWAVPLDIRTAEHAVNTGEPFVTKGRSRIKSAFVTYVNQLADRREPQPQSGFLRRFVANRTGTAS